jgi:hypothetical protein
MPGRPVSRAGLCTLDHSGAEAEVRLTYDPSLPEYTIAIRLAEPWPEATVFAMRFEGPQGNMISTPAMSCRRA